jgi:hypothetical protein
MVRVFLTFSDTQILPTLKILTSIFNCILSHSTHCVYRAFLFSNGERRYGVPAGLLTVTNYKFRTRGKCTLLVLVVPTVKS